MNIVLNGGKLLKDITEAIASWKASNFSQFGIDIGDFVYNVLLVNVQIRFGPDDIYNLVKGLLLGLRFPDVDPLMKWINNVPDIYNDIVDIINLLEHIDFKHLTNLIEAISKILTLVSGILKDLEPCASGPNSDYLHKVIKAFANADIVKIAMNILLNGGQVLKDILDAISSFNKNDFN